VETERRKSPGDGEPAVETTRPVLVILPLALQAELDAAIDEADNEAGESAEAFFERLKRFD